MVTRQQLRSLNSTPSSIGVFEEQGIDLLEGLANGVSFLYPVLKSSAVLSEDDKCFYINRGIKTDLGNKARPNAAAIKAAARASREKSVHEDKTLTKEQKYDKLIALNKEYS